MNSKKKLSQIKSFAKGKVNEFINGAEEEILNQLILSDFTLHLDHYSYENYGNNLISIRVKDTDNIDFDKLQYDIETLCYQRKLGLYPTIDEESMELQFFNKALNNHIKTYQLLKQDESQQIENISHKIAGDRGVFISDCIKELRQLLFISNSMHIELVNRLIDEEDESKSILDDIRLEGVLQKVNDKTIIIDNAYFAKVTYQIDVYENWEIVSIGNWGKNDLNEISIKIVA